MKMYPSARLPAEWEPQRSVWLTWPGNPQAWAGYRDQVKQDHAHLVSMCSRYQPVDLICTTSWRAECERCLRAAKADLHQITFHDWPVNDAWIRDTGPVVLKTETGMEAVDLPFNAWGGKFPDWEDDDRIAQRVSDLRNVPCRRFPMFGEGGGLESNGQGVLLVTESVWLNPNRNPGVGRNEMEKLFQSFFGAREIFWLQGGMSTDDTDGHIDTLARFVDAHTVVVPIPQADDEDIRILTQNARKLAASFHVLPLPHPLIQNAPASYANFVFLNGAVLFPSFGTKEDELVRSVFTEVFPGREIVAIPSRTFVEEGGAVHCLTLNEWA